MGKSLPTPKWLIYLLLLCCMIENSQLLIAYWLVQPGLCLRVRSPANGGHEQDGRSQGIWWAVPIRWKFWNPDTISSCELRARKGLGGDGVCKKALPILLEFPPHSPSLTIPPLSAAHTGQLHSKAVQRGSYLTSLPGSTLGALAG